MPDLPIAAPGRRTGYRVHLQVFEGPLDLLLHLIEREELDITRLSLARVTAQYLEYIAALEKLQVDDLSDFIVVAARLLLIKSQALLPRPPTPAQQHDEDAGEQLIRQLRRYKQYKEVAKRLEERQRGGQRSYVRLAAQPNVEIGTEHLDPVPLQALLTAAQRILETRAVSPHVEEIVTPFSLTINDQIELITETLRRHHRISFTDLLTSTYSRQEVAVTLIALLELIKQEAVRARQDKMFGEIMIQPAT